MDQGPDEGTLHEETLGAGLHDRLLTHAIVDAARRSKEPLELDRETFELTDHGAVELAARLLERMVGRSVVRALRRSAPGTWVATVNALLQELDGDDADRNERHLVEPLQRLLAVRPPGSSPADERPDLPLADSWLLTGGREDHSLSSQLRREIRTADRIDVLCSFIKWSGLRLLLDDLRALAERPGRSTRIRVISTSYLGATDARAIEALAALPRTEVRISYDTQRTRLHAKAYIVRRASGFGSAYVGSANISGPALSEGLEWTSKISEFELPRLWRKVVGTFDTYWCDDEFQSFDASQAERLRAALAEERGSSQPLTLALPGLDLKPYPFQQEILEAIDAERQVQDRHRHLVVAATGTGKTMIAAFDYRHWARARREQDGAGDRPRLLFIAHRREILEQALGTYRHVLRDQNFGDLLVGGHRPSSLQHLFCSIQSVEGGLMGLVEPDHFDYVVVDEFHHAAAPTYERLLDWLQPRVLLGLTATPERADGLDIVRWFEGRTSAEIRLPDAIERRFLCPFQYFGVADSVDLSGVRWENGRYRLSDLEDVYTGDDARAQLVVDKVHEIVLDPRRARGIGFCVSVAHAQFMAGFFERCGIPAMALSAETPADERRAARDRLRRREINFVFAVDLFNEGVDIPELDVALFLRPTESLTVFLQQFGRGLRLHDEKEFLTVIDFVGMHRKEFRFAPRFRALGTEPTRSVAKEIEHGFLSLPSGCSIELERMAQERILANVRAATWRKADVVRGLRDLGSSLGRVPGMIEAVEALDIEPETLAARGAWGDLLHAAGLRESGLGPDSKVLSGGLGRLVHVDDPWHLDMLLAWLEGDRAVSTLSELERRHVTMLHVALWGKSGQSWTLEEAERRLRTNAAAIESVREVLRLGRKRTRVQPIRPAEARFGPLSVHASYSRDEILVGLGVWSMQERRDVREGVLHLKNEKLDVFFVTVHKSESDYSVTTMYEDYAISEEFFHWQSQSTTSVDSATGRRYREHQRLGYTPILFVRSAKRQGTRTVPYVFVGPADYESHEGSKPISILWRLRHQLPVRHFRAFAEQRVG